MKKYELTAESIVKFGRTLFRIKALVAFGDVEEGELGGFIEKEKNLDQSGNAWVYGDAWVFKMSHYITVGPIGSRDDFTTFFRTKNLTIGVKCGCFKGDTDKFFEAVEKTHGNNKHARAYKAAIALAKLQIDLSKEDSDEEETGKES
nr:MAG TPA: putative transferase, nesg, ydcK, Structural Genomics.38A [Bacteriophage sp.]